MDGGLGPGRQIARLQVRKLLKQRFSFSFHLLPKEVCIVKTCYNRRGFNVPLILETSLENKMTSTVDKPKYDKKTRVIYEKLFSFYPTICTYVVL